VPPKPTIIKQTLEVIAEAGSPIKSTGKKTVEKGKKGCVDELSSKCVSNDQKEPKVFDIGRIVKVKSAHYGRTKVGYVVAKVRNADDVYVVKDIFTCEAVVLQPTHMTLCSNKVVLDQEPGIVTLPPHVVGELRAVVLTVERDRIDADELGLVRFAHVMEQVTTDTNTILLLTHEQDMPTMRPDTVPYESQYIREPELVLRVSEDRDQIRPGKMALVHCKIDELDGWWFAEVVSVDAEKVTVKYAKDTCIGVSKTVFRKADVLAVL
jgi:hypothetical protein